MPISSEERIQFIRDQIYPAYAQISYLPLRVQAVHHTSMVETWARYLAGHRNVRDDLAACAAILHDIARYQANTSARHAFKGARMAETLLEQSDLFSQDEIHQIVHAIACHSDKDRIDEPLCEVLKDADTLASWTVSFDTAQSPDRQRRIKALQEELGWSVPSSQPEETAQ